MNSETFIKTVGLSYSYDEYDTENKKFALNDVSVEIKKGSFVAVLGHNGSGKSTFAKLLNMILTPDAGEIYVDGKLVSSATEPDDDTVFEVRKKIGMVHQNPDNQIVSSIVEEDVAFGPENLGVPTAEIRKRVDDALAVVGMSEYARHSPSRLSGGQKQRIAIAGIIAMMPECIILDESTAMLDPVGRAEVMETVDKLNKDRGITVINITHDMSEATMADRIIVLDHGKIFADGTPTEVFANVSELRAIGLDVPQTTALLYELSKHGFEFPRGMFDAKQTAEFIKSELERMKGARYE